MYHGVIDHKKINNPFLISALHCWCTDRKTDRQTNRQAENSDFNGPSIGQGSKNLNLEQNAALIEEEKIIKL